MPHRLQRLLLVLFVGYAAVALTVLYWGVWRSEELLVREDNPRTVEAELRLVRGRILDRNGVVLAESIPLDESGRLLRHYPWPDVGAAVGYYSLRYGTAGVEQGVDDALRGQTAVGLASVWRDLLNQPPLGRDVRLTLDAQWQQTAAQLLGDQRGAVVLISLPDGAIRALVSHPSFDPSQLDQQFEALAQDPTAPLLNRVTQASYQPGLALQPFLLAAALDQQLLRLADEVAEATAAVPLNGQTITCASEPPIPTTWADVLRASCPAPMLSLRLSVADVQQALANFGLITPPVSAALPLPLAEAHTAPIADLELALLGQEQLTVTPLQLALALGMLAQDGQPVVPRLVSAVQDEAGEWQSVAVATPAAATTTAVRPDTAQAIRAAFTLSPDQRLAELATLALAGETRHAWYLGLAPATAPRYVVVVVVEEAADVSAGQAVGRGVLTAVLQ